MGFSSNLIFWGGEPLSRIHVVRMANQKDDWLSAGILPCELNLICRACLALNNHNHLNLVTRNAGTKGENAVPGLTDADVAHV